jgi:hypothetical protein
MNGIDVDLVRGQHNADNYTGCRTLVAGFVTIKVGLSMTCAHRQ